MQHPSVDKPVRLLFIQFKGKTNAPLSFRPAVVQLLLQPSALLAFCVPLQHDANVLLGG